MQTKQIALFGGAFNPPTVAHGAIIEAIAEQDIFDEIWVMPSKSRSDKKIELSQRTRAEMVREMIQSELSMYSNVFFSDYELRLPGKTATAKTLRSLARNYPHVEFTMVIGEDSLATLPEWESGEWLLQTGRWLIVPRLEKKPVKTLPKFVSYLPITTAGISSTIVRSAVQEGKSIRTLVHPSTENLIVSKGLYNA